MGILVIGGVLIGTLLGQFFKCFVLIPACGIAVILVLTNPAHLENSLPGWFLQAAVVTISLQFGLRCWVVRDYFHRKPKRSKKLGTRGLDEISSRLAETSEGGRRAA